MMRRIGVIVAMRAEYDLVRGLFDKVTDHVVGKVSFTTGKIAGIEVILTLSGIGKVSSAVATVELIRNYSPELIINTGIAGGVDAALRVMDVVVGQELVYHDVWCGEGNKYGQVQGLPARFFSDPTLLQLALRVEHDGRVKAGLICSGDQFVTDKTELERIKGHFPEALGVDMESCSIAQVCYMYEVPFLSYRIISDTPGMTEDHARQYADFWTEAPRRSFEMIKQLIQKIDDR